MSLKSRRSAIMMDESMNDLERALDELHASTRRLRLLIMYLFVPASVLFTVLLAAACTVLTR